MHLPFLFRGNCSLLIAQPELENSHVVLLCYKLVAFVVILCRGGQSGSAWLSSLGSRLPTLEDTL